MGTKIYHNLLQRLLNKIFVIFENRRKRMEKCNLMIFCHSEFRYGRWFLRKIFFFTAEKQKKSCIRKLLSNFIFLSWWFRRAERAKKQQNRKNMLASRNRGDILMDRVRATKRSLEELCCRFF